MTVENNEANTANQVFDDLYSNLPDNLDDIWQASVKRKRLQIRVPTAILVLILIAAGAFWGGAIAQNSENHSSATSALSSFASRFASGKTGGSAFFSHFASNTQAAPTASGELVGVKGNVLYLTTSSGSLMKIIVGKATTISRDNIVKISSLSIGDTVTVEGKRIGSNTVNAESVAATAKSVPTTTVLAPTGFGTSGNS